MLFNLTHAKGNNILQGNAQKLDSLVLPIYKTNYVTPTMNNRKSLGFNTHRMDRHLSLAHFLHDLIFGCWNSRCQLMSFSSSVQQGWLWKLVKTETEGMIRGKSLLHPQMSQYGLKSALTYKDPLTFVTVLYSLGSLRGFVKSDIAQTLTLPCRFIFYDNGILYISIGLLLVKEWEGQGKEWEIAKKKLSTSSKI